MCFWCCPSCLSSDQLLYVMIVSIIISIIITRHYSHNCHQPVIALSAWFISRKDGPFSPSIRNGRYVVITTEILLLSADNECTSFSRLFSCCPNRMRSWIEFGVGISICPTSSYLSLSLSLAFHIPNWYFFLSFRIIIFKWFLSFKNFSARSSHHLFIFRYSNSRFHSKHICISHQLCSLFFVCKVN